MQSKIKEILKELIEIPSVSGNIQELHKICNFIENFFANIPDIFISKYVFNEIPSLVISNFEGLESDICFNGHFDVVPPSEENQFKIQEKNGKIFARGSGDMKAGIAIIVTLCKEIFSEKQTNKKITLMLTGDEEVGGFNGVKKLVEEIGYFSKIIIIPDGGSANEIIISEKGLASISVNSCGKSSHASKYWLGENAIENILSFFSDLKEFFCEKDDEKNHWNNSVNLTIIKGGNTGNVIPDFAEANFDIRLVKDYGNEQKTKAIIEKIAIKNNCKILNFTFGKVLLTDENDILVQKYLKSARKILGKNVIFTKEHGASDGRFFSTRNIPVILHRPTCENIHSKGEYVVENDLEKIYQIYYDFILFTDITE